MINQFRSLNPVNLIFLALVAIILRVGVLVKLPEQLSFSLFEPYADILVKVPEDFFTPFSNVFYAAVIVFIQAVLLNRIVNNYNLLGKPSFIPALMYVTATSLLEPFIVLSPALIANFLIIWMIDKFLSIYRREQVLSVIFDLGMIVAAGALIYSPFVVMLPLVWLALIVFRPFYWREWLAAPLGFITVCFFIGTFYYLKDSLDIFLDSGPLATTFRTGFKVNLYDYTVLIPLVLILILSFFTLRSKFYRSNVHVRKAYYVLLFLFLFGLLSFYVKSEYSVHHFLLALPAASVFMGHFFASSTRRWFYEGLYILLAVFIIYFQFV